MHNNIILIELNKVGLPTALNTSIKKTKTKYYARMDADDISHPKRLETQIDYLEKNTEIEILGTWAIEFNNEEELLNGFVKKLPSDMKSIKKIFHYRNPLIHPSVVFKMTVFKKIGFYNPNYKTDQDLELWARALKLNIKLTNIPIQKNIKNIKTYDFYFLSFFTNFIELLNNSFDSRLTKCHINTKKKLFEFFINSIIQDSKKYNQKIIIITFNLVEDITNEESWRYNYIKKFLNQKNIIHIDSLEILKKNIKLNNENPESYYGTDLHNNSKSFNYIYNKLFEIYNAM